MGRIIAGLGACAFTAIGLGALAAPRFSSEQYGLPATDPRALAFVRALGARDLALGLIVAGLARRGSRSELAWALGLSAIVGAADFAIVASSADSRRAALGVHAAGTLALLAAATIAAR